MASASASSPAAAHIRATKRKLDEAFDVLDNAVTHSSDSSAPPPAKRLNTSRSLYSTLTKYGIQSRQPRQQIPGSDTLESKFKNAPHLTAILKRTASRTKNIFPFKFATSPTTPAPALPATAEYRPSSLPCFLSRLATFKLSTYSNKPADIDAVAAAKCGWINDGKDRLVCGICNASWVVTGRDGMSRDAVNALLERQRKSLVDSHKNGCPWKARQCDSSIYCIPLQPPAFMVREIRNNAKVLHSVLQDVAIKHPLTMSQLNSLRSTLNSYTDNARDANEPIPSSQASPASSQASEQLSDASILGSLFGWSIVPTGAVETLRKPSLSRAASLAPPDTPRSFRSRSPSRASPKPASPKPFLLPSSMFKKPENLLLQCSLCQRRIGLWAFAPLSIRNKTADANEPSQSKRISTRQFDLLKEHRSYCPYVVRSTVLPSLPLPPTSSFPDKVNAHRHSPSSFSQSNALEGWKAVLSVVLRYGMAQRQRNGAEFSGESESDATNTADIDEVQEMVNGVKSRGGKDLLKYIKGLLG